MVKGLNKISIFLGCVNGNLIIFFFVFKFIDIINFGINFSCFILVLFLFNINLNNFFQYLNLLACFFILSRIIWYLFLLLLLPFVLILLFFFKFGSFFLLFLSDIKRNIAIIWNLREFITKLAQKILIFLLTFFMHYKLNILYCLNFFGLYIIHLFIMLDNICFQPFIFIFS